MQYLTRDSSSDEKCEAEFDESTRDFLREGIQCCISETSALKAPRSRKPAFLLPYFPPMKNA